MMRDVQITLDDMVTSTTPESNKSLMTTEAFLLRFQLFMLVGSPISSHCLDRQSVLEYSRSNLGQPL
jgi:hypothetical protein